LQAAGKLNRFARRVSVVKSNIPKINLLLRGEIQGYDSRDSGKNQKHILQLGPDRSMPLFVFFLVAWSAKNKAIM
jgi:hypothetical protein